MKSIGSQLYEGIKVFAEDADYKSRIKISYGVTKPSENVNVNYSENAVVPQKPWRVPTNQEIEILTSKIDFEEIGNCISIFSLKEQPIVHILRQLYEDTLRGIVSSSDYQSKANELLNTDTFRKIYTCIGVPTVAGLAVHQNGLETVTINRKTGKYIGLHLDSWDNLPSTERHLSTNRICINLSDESRYFLFLNLSISQLLKLSQLDKNTIPDLLCIEFMKNNPNYPIVRLEVKPFEAYVAPTENIIHDATTENMNSDSFSFTFRGHFKLNPLNGSKKKA
jgi:hypothetical protein